MVKEDVEPSVKDGNAYMNWLFNKYYGKPPELKWSSNKTRQATVEKRIKKLVYKKKPFYLTVTKSDKTTEEWYVDGGNWVSAKASDGNYGGIVGHINNLLPFLKGSSIIVWDLVAGKTPKRKQRVKRK